MSAEEENHTEEDNHTEEGNNEEQEQTVEEKQAEAEQSSSTTRFPIAVRNMHWACTKEQLKRFLNGKQIIFL